MVGLHRKMVIFLMKTSNFEKDKKYLVKLKHLAISQDFLGFLSMLNLTEIL